jgi:mannose-1-phosphate guanylyltransferase
MSSVKAGEGRMVVLPFEWWDFGTWESVDKYLKEKNLYQTGSNVIELDSNNNFVRSEKEVALIGVDNLVVVDTGDALLICKKDQTGRVGEVVEKLKAEGKNELL